MKIHIGKLIRAAIRIAPKVAAVVRAIKDVVRSGER